MMVDEIEKLREGFLKPSFKNSYAYYIPRKFILNAIEKVKEKLYGEVLDLGCGIMPYKQLISTFPNVTSYRGLDLENSNYHNKIKPDVYWDGQTIPFKDNTFDTVIATEFLEHYHETESIFLEIKRVLKPNGILFFTVPFLWPLHEVPYDEFRFTPFYFQKKLTELGFQTEVFATGGYNSSLAQMILLYVSFGQLSRFKKRVLRRLTMPLVKSLLNKEEKAIEFKNNQMITGLYGIATKNQNECP